MSLSRRQFLKNTSIGAAGLIGGAGLLKKSAFAAYPAATTSNVSFVGGTSSYTGGRKQMIMDVLAPFKSVIAAGIQGRNIIIKPNCTCATVLAATHVDALSGLITFLRTITSAPIMIAEGNPSSNTLAVMQALGYNALTTAFTGVTLADTNPSSPYPWAANWLWKTDLKSTQKINVSSLYVTGGNYLISICRPKTHNCMVVTAATKNIAMGMPIFGDTLPTGTNSKTAMHAVGNNAGIGPGEDKALAYNIFQVATQFTLKGYPNLSILDAWEGMQGQGPNNGTSVMQYCAVAGTDHIAVDRLAVKLMGLSDTAILTPPLPPLTPSYTDPRYLLWMSNAGIGNYDLSKINFVNGTLANLTTFVKQYTMSNFYSASPYYEAEWQSDTTLGPKKSIDSTAAFPPVSAIRGGPAFMTPQAFMHADGVISGNEVKIEIALGSGYRIDLGIFNIAGREVRRLGSEYLKSGRYSIVWDCRDDHGAKVSNGNYIIKMRFDGRQMCDKIAIAR